MFWRSDFVYCDMAIQDKIRRYHLIIEKIRKSKKPSFKELQDFLRTHDFPISHRTLQRDIEQIKYELNISIEYDRTTNGYFLEDDGFSHKTVELLQHKNFYADLMEFTKQNPKHKEAILLDNDVQQKGFEYIQPILTAIRQQRKIEFEYQKFKEEKPKKYILEPYALKEFENRWYLAGIVDAKPDLHKFGIERIVSLNITTAKFSKNKTISTTEHFARMIGINDQQRNRETIQLAFTPLLAKYVETVPLHWSQKEISREKNWVTFEYFVIPNFELEQKILSYGTELKVLKPLKLKNRIKQILETSWKNYE